MDVATPPAGGAAFFDLDKTLLATSSSVALRDPLLEAGLITRRSAAIGLLIHLPYLLRGADAQAMERMRDSLGELAKGWDAAVLERTVDEALTRSIDPVSYTEALDMVALHKLAHQPVVVASASVEQMVRPIARLFGADFAIGSIAHTDDDGTFTGTIDRFTYADAKAQACIDLAAQQGWDMSKSFAYSDSITDLPLLEAVGHPVAVNPDRALREVARERDWQIMSFTHTVRVRVSPTKVILPVVATSVAVGVAGYALWRARRLWL